jgi:SAM-dependent methyltransferase
MFATYQSPNGHSMMRGRTEYERLQQHNFLTSWLHSQRFTNVLKTVAQFAKVFPQPFRILDIGCGPAKLYALLDSRYAIDYHGYETDLSFVEAVRSRYGQRPNFRISGQPIREANLTGYDIIAALEVLEHIEERAVVRLVEAIAEAQPKLFICSVPVEIGPALWLKNIGSWLCRYPRHMEYSWRQTFWGGLYQLDKLPAHRTGHLGFDWRWLAQTIRHNMHIQSLTKSPLALLPAAVSASVFIVAVPKVPNSRR